VCRLLRRGEGQASGFRRTRRWSTGARTPESAESAGNWPAFSEDGCAVKVVPASSPKVGTCLVDWLTGGDTVATNYPGKAVELRRGTTAVARSPVAGLDVPGQYPHLS